MTDNRLTTLSLFRELTIEIKQFDSVTSENIYSQFSKWIIHLRHPIVTFISSCFLEYQQSGYSELYLDTISVAISMLSSWVNSEYSYDVCSELYQDHAWLTLRHLVMTPVSIAVTSDVNEWTVLTQILNFLPILFKQFKYTPLNQEQIQIPDLIITTLQFLIDILGAISSPKDESLIKDQNIYALGDSIKTEKLKTEKLVLIL